MYALRALAVSLSVFVLVQALVSIVLCSGWPLVRRMTRYARKPALANLLFGMQIAPVACATVVVGCFTLPSFLRFEPRAANEGLGIVAVGLAVVAIAILLAGTSRALRSSRRSARAAAEWARLARPADHQTGIPAFQPQTDGLLAVTGLARQTLFISRDVAGALTAEELQRAIAHEMAHVRRRDNLAKLAVTFCRVPGMRNLERAWLQAVEMTADQRSVKNKAEALELASALVKVSRLRVQQLPELATGFAAGSAGSLSVRVEHLLAWEETLEPGQSRAQVAIACSLFAALAANALAYHSILLQVHAFTEWLVR
jgi:beta-lactamase regulating signal transducer with metallopeptidase domain